MQESTFGRYQLRELLGRGGMGHVYRAYDTDTDRIVAVKVLPPQLAGDPEYQQRFRREARTAAGLNDPHIVPIHSYGEIDGRLYVDMRLIDGRDLGALIADQGGRLSPARAVAIIEQVATALDTAHRAGLIHRDIKPANILVAATDFAYLIDFGIARTIDDTAMTNTGQAVGTLSYMAPERFNGVTDPRSDVYALTCVLHECLTGNRPYPGESLEQQLLGHLNSPAPQPSLVAPDVPAAFDAVIARGMAKDPDQRYQTAAELAHAARTALDRPTLPPQPPTQLAATRLARPPAPPDRDAHQRARRRRTWIITGLVNLVVVAVAAAVSVAVLANRDSSEATASGPTSGTTTSSSQLPPLNPSPQLGADCQYPPSAEPASKSVNPPRSGNVSTEPAQVSVGMMTDQGPIGLMLDNARSPCTVNSFISLAGQKFFDNTQCHRLTTAPTLHVLQCGDPAGNGSGGPGYEFANEYPTTQHQPDDPALDTPISYPRGTLAMANAGPDTNGSQFFLVYADSQLPPLYTIFGTIQSDGLATLDKIAAAGVEGGGDDGAPAAPVTITSIRMD